MDVVTSLVATEEALAKARIWRRLCVTGFGALAGVAVLVGAFSHDTTAFARWAPAGIFLIPPVASWSYERRLARRLSRLLDDSGLKKT